MVQHARDIRGVVANCPAWLRVGKAKTGPIERDVPQPRLRRSLVPGQATSGRAMAVNNGTCTRVGIAPNRVSDMPAIGDLHTIRPDRSVHSDGAYRFQPIGAGFRSFGGKQAVQL